MRRNIYSLKVNIYQKLFLISKRFQNGGSAAKVRAVIDKDIFTTDMFT